MSCTLQVSVASLNRVGWLALGWLIVVELGGRGWLEVTCGRS